MVRQINGGGNEETRQRSGASSADKLLSVLIAFASKSEPRSVEDLANELSIPHSTMYRYVRSLSDVGLIVAISAGSYILGPSIIALDRQMRLSDPLLICADPVKSRLASELPGPGRVLVCRLFRSSVMCVDSAATGELGFQVSYSRGRELPLFRGAASKVILAHLPLRNVRALFESDQREFASSGLGGEWKTVRASLSKIRQQGFSISHGELDEGALGLASPVFGLEGRIYGSLAYVMNEMDVIQDNVEELCKIIKEGAESIENSLASFLNRRG